MNVRGAAPQYPMQGNPLANQVNYYCHYLYAGVALYLIGKLLVAI